MTSIDMSEVMDLAHDLGKIPGRLVNEVDAVVKKAADNVKKDMVNYAQFSVGGGYAKHFPRSISYDRAAKFGEIAYEVGPDKGRTQGALGNLLYFGSANNAPVLDIEVGINDEAPKFEKHLGDLVEGLLDE
jgi:hypothetical protein